MAQEVKKYLLHKPDDLSLVLITHRGNIEPTRKSFLLVSVHELWHVCTSTHNNKLLKTF